MKNKTHIVWPVLVATSTMAVPLNKPVEDSFVNRLTLNARFGLNIGAKFGARTTPEGGLYNYVDGYVLTDSTGNANPTDGSEIPGPLTQYWGYNNSPRQVVGNTIVLTRSAAGSDLLSHKFDDDPRLGAELVYSRELGKHDKWTYGFEVGIGYMNLCLRDNSSYTGTGTQDAFPFFAGTTPPEAGTVAHPDAYQGAFNLAQQAGFVIGAVPVSSIPGQQVSIAGRHQFDADIWGLRVGPYLSHPLGKHAEINLVGGFAAALINAHTEWSETSTIGGVTDPAQAGRGHNCDVLWGYYIGANVSWHLNKRWDLNAGVQFQDLGVYRQTTGNRVAEIDMSAAIYVTVGIAYKF